MDKLCDKNELKLYSKPEPINRQQIIIFIFLCYGNFWSNACFSLIAPFFPKEAEAKGATPTHYGLIFSVYQLMYLITAPIFAKFMYRFSPTILCALALFIESISYVLFGLLIYVPNGTPFIASGFALRIIGGTASTIFLMCSFALVLKVFPDKPVFMTSVLSIIIQLGQISGPAIGGALYQWGGFIIPFASMGALLMLGSILLIILVPWKIEKSSSQRNSLWRFILDPGAFLDALTIIVATTFFGFNSTTLEPHLRQFNLKPIIIGVIFISSSVVYGVTTLVFAKLCDRGWDSKKLNLFGNIWCIIGLLLIGPQVFIPLDTKLWLIIVSLVIIGLGNTANMVTTFDSLLNDSVNRRGLPDDISTYSMVSAHYLFSYSVGAIVGSSLGGYLLEKVGYRKATFPLLIVQIVMTILLLVYVLCNNVLIVRRKKIHLGIKSKDDHKEIKY